MKRIMFLLWIAGCFTPVVLQAAVEKVTIKGCIKGLGDQELILMNSDRSEIARTRTKNDDFKITADLETGDLRHYLLYAPSVGPLGPSMSVPTLYFFADSKKITIKAELKDQQIKKLTVKGSPGEKETRKLMNSLPSSARTEKVYKDYNDAFEAYNVVEQSVENRKKLTEASERLTEWEKQRKKEIFDLIPVHRNSMALANMVAAYFDVSNAGEAEKTWEQFDPAIRHCEGMKAMEELIRRHRASSVGQKAPDFELPDENGKPVALSSLRGKYVLIDFWASWCGPCRREIPNLKKVYAEFKEKGLLVVGVSIDSSEKDWRKAMKEEEMEYLQLHDAKNITGKLYNFNGIPFIILISPEGVILEKNLRGPDIREKIAGYIR